MFNYADDNTLSHASYNYNELVNTLVSESKILIDWFYNELVNTFVSESKILIDWFHFNCMQANPEKFQAIAVGRKQPIIPYECQTFWPIDISDHDN